MDPGNEPAMIAHLNHLPTWLLEEARSLAGPDAVQSLLMAHTSPECWEYLTPFIEDVVFGKEPAASWLLGQVIAPDFSLRDQLTLARSALLAPIGGKFTHRITPVLDDWRGNASWIGAPALVLPNADYRFRAPAHVIAMGNAATEEVADSTAPTRRWIAARLAQVVKNMATIRSIEQLIATHRDLPGMADWSDDAKRAASALIREYQELGEHGDTVPGMRGPDDWYYQALQQ